MTASGCPAVPVPGPRPVAHESHPSRVSHTMGGVNTPSREPSDYIYNRGGRF